MRKEERWILTMKMTYDEYDDMLELFNTLTAKPYYPDPIEISKMEENPDEWLKFVCYLYEKGSKPHNQQEQYSRENLKNFIEKYLTLEDATVVKVLFAPTEHGKIDFDDEGTQKREIGSICTIHVTPDAGYVLARAYVLDGLFQKKCICKLDENLSFEVPDMDVVLCTEFKEEL